MLVVRFFCQLKDGEDSYDRRFARILQRWIASAKTTLQFGSGVEVSHHARSAYGAYAPDRGDRLLNAAWVR